METINKYFNTYFLSIIVFSALAGSGISYNKLYLIHILIGLGIVYCIAHYKNFNLFINKIQRETKITTILIFFYILFSSLILYPSQDTIKYSIIFLHGLALIMIILFCSYISYDTFWKKFNAGFLTFYIINGIICLLEICTPFRYPWSRYSSYHISLGLSPFDRFASFNLTLVENVPTGFFYNENALCLFLIIALPFFIFCFDSKYLLVANAFTFLIITMANARLSFIVLIVLLIILTILFLCSYIFPKLNVINKYKYLTFGITTFFFITYVVTDGFGNLSEGHPITELNTYHIFPHLKHGITVTDQSIAIRIEQIKNALYFCKKQPLLGIGGYNFLQKTASIGGTSKFNTYDLHFYWLQLLVELGLIGFIFYFIWLCIPIYTLMITHIKHHNKINISILLSITIIIINCPAVGSLHYFIPMYLLWSCLFVQAFTEKWE